jgi:hypothetical protein
MPIREVMTLFQDDPFDIRSKIDSDMGLRCNKVARCSELVDGYLCD